MVCDAYPRWAQIGTRRKNSRWDHGEVYTVYALVPSATHLTIEVKLKNIRAASDNELREVGRMALCVPLDSESPGLRRVGHSDFIATAFVVLRGSGGCAYFKYLRLSLC